MKLTLAIVAAIVFCTASLTWALYSVSDTGDWPKTWPKELEPLRKQSKTLVGPMFEHQHFAIPFTKREEFEAAWPSILKVKTRGAPVVLVRGPNFFLDKAKAGVVVHSPPAGRPAKPAQPPGPIDPANVRTICQDTTWIELLVDGDIVDLNRIPLPAETPMVDERFKEGKDK